MARNLIKIASFNINGITGRLPILLRWLKECKPHIVCQQELKTTSDKFPEKAINLAGYEAICRGQKAWNGVAILSKIGAPQELRGSLPGDAKDEQARYIEAIVGQMVVACIYAPNGNPYPSEKFEYKLSWYRRFTAHAKKLLKEDVPVLLVGDFNIMPTDLDVYKAASWYNDALFRIEVRKAFQRLISQGWTDAIREIYPDQKIYTFWDYLYKAWENNRGLRLDHFLLSQHLTNQLKAGGVDTYVRDWEKTSDHAPVWITLKR